MFDQSITSGCWREQPADDGLYHTFRRLPNFDYFVSARNIPDENVDAACELPSTEVVRPSPIFLFTHRSWRRRASFIREARDGSVNSPRLLHVGRHRG